MLYNKDELQLAIKILWRKKNEDILIRFYDFRKIKLFENNVNLSNYLRNCIEFIQSFS